MRDFTLFEAQTGGAFDRLNWQHSGEFDQNFSKKVKRRGVCPGGGAWAVLELTGTLAQRFSNMTECFRNPTPIQIFFARAHD